MFSESPESRSTTTGQKRPCCHCRVNRYTCTKKFAIILDDLKRDVKVLEAFYKTSGDPNLKCIETILSSTEADIDKIAGMIRMGEKHAEKTDGVREGPLLEKACAIKCLYKELVSKRDARNHVPNSEICKCFNKILKLEEGAQRIGAAFNKVEKQEGEKSTRIEYDNNKPPSRVEMAYRSETARKSNEGTNFAENASISAVKSADEHKLNQKEIRRDILERDLERLMLANSADTFEDSNLQPVKKTKSETHIERIASFSRDSCSANPALSSISGSTRQNEAWDDFNESTDTAKSDTSSCDGVQSLPGVAEEDDCVQMEPVPATSHSL